MKLPPALLFLIPTAALLAASIAPKVAPEPASTGNCYLRPQVAAR